MKAKSFYPRLSKPRLSVFACLIALICLTNSGCSTIALGPKPTPKVLATEDVQANLPTETPTESPTQTPEKTPESGSSGQKSDPKTGVKTSKVVLAKYNLPYSSSKGSTAVPAYSAEPGLSNVENISLFPDLTASQIAMLEKNLFVVVPGGEEQLSYVYENNQYEQIPSFITTDSVLHLYHMFFDSTLSSIEENNLYGVCDNLSSNMFDKVSALSSEANDPDVKAALNTAAAYFAISKNLISGTTPSGSFDGNLVRQELDLIEQHSGFTQSPLTGAEIFYDNFLPRGHYTKSDTLTRYFKAMIWYGTMFYPLDGKNENTLRALVTTYALMTLDKDKGADLWESIYLPTTFFVGAADDITPYDVWNAMHDVYGEYISLDSLNDPDALSRFSEKIKEYDKARIINENSEDGQSAYTGMGFRFMGQRYIPDSEILQRLSKPILRPVPSGLDVAAVLGASNAESYIDKYLSPTKASDFGTGWSDYPMEFQKVKADFQALSEDTWRSNMYYGWLWTLSSEFNKPERGMPAFMQSAAWYDKQLATGLGSWAQLRHDTLLYAKASGAEMGDGFEELPKGYVEPNAELYNRLRWLTKYTAESLKERGIISDYRYDLCGQIIEMLDKLIELTQKELSNQTFTEEEYNYIVSYGGLLDYLLVCSVRGDDSSDDILSDRNMATIADVHNTTSGFLHEAVGRANHIYVVVPNEGKLYLARGAVFDYYELFMDQKYTDEMWKELIKPSNANAPSRPAWTESFIDTSSPSNYIDEEEYSDSLEDSFLP